MQNFQQYAFQDNITQLNADTFNAIWRDLDSRIGNVEQLSPQLQAAISTLVTTALARINDALIPAFNTITEIQTLGFLSAPIQLGTNAVFAVNASTLVQVSTSQSQFFVPPPWVALVRAANATDYCLARVLSYIPVTGALSLDITDQQGNPGTYTDVTIVGCPGGAIAAIDAYAGITAAVATVNAAVATVQADLAIVAADTAYVAGVVLAGPVTSVDGLTGSVVLGDEKTVHKGAASGYAALDANAHVPSGQLPIGLANGVAGLGLGATVPISQLPVSIQNCFQYQGLWNAGTNSPSLASGQGVQGQFYKVSTAGSTILDGNSIWFTGDYLFFDGVYWERISAPITYTPVQQGTGSGQSPAFPIKIGWNATSQTLTAYVTESGGDVALGNVWDDTYVTGNAPACRTALAIPAVPKSYRNLINTITAANSANLIDATSFLTAGYVDYEIILDNIVPAAQSTLVLTLQASGAWQITNYSYRGLDALSGGLGGSFPVTTVGINLTDSSYPMAAGGPGLSGTIKFFNVQGSSVQKLFTIDTSYNSTSGANRVILGGFWNGNAPVTGFTVQLSSGAISSGTVKVFGIG